MVGELLPEIKFDALRPAVDHGANPTLELIEAI